MKKVEKSLINVLRQHNGYTANGRKVCAYATQRYRAEVLKKGFADLREMGYKLKAVQGFRGKHMQALAKQWEAQGLSASTLSNRISVFKTLSGWLGKQGMILSPEHYVTKKTVVRRTLRATESRTWSSQGVSVSEKIEAVRRDCRASGDALSLQHRFGLRSKESLLIKPHLADKGAYLLVEHGTKGGRMRTVPITTPDQRTLLDQIKEHTGHTASLVPSDKRYSQFRDHYYYVLQKHGISRKEGITAHGLRHEHLNNLYRETTGQASKIEGGQLHKQDRDLDKRGRLIVAERAGHSREDIAAAYLGGKT